MNINNLLEIINSIDSITSTNFIYIILIILLFMSLTSIITIIVILLFKIIEKIKNRNKIKVKSILKRIKFEEEQPKAIKNILSGTKNEEDEEIPEWLENWIVRTESRFSNSGVKRISIIKYVSIIVLSLSIALLTGAGFLRNTSVTIILVVSSFFVPDIIISTYVQRRRLKMIEQLSSATRIFSAEFRATPQVLTALSNTAERVPYPLKEVFENAVIDLTVGKNKDEVFDEMMKTMDFDYGNLFVQLLRLASEDTSIQPLFTKLSTKIASLQSLIQKNQSSLAYGRIMGMVVNILIIPAFFGVCHFIPGAYDFMVHHPVGKLIITMCFCSILIGLILDKILHSARI